LVCDYETIGNLLKVNCKNCVFGSSLEDFEECMARTIDKILEVKKVDRIILSEAREYEYDYDETKMMVEIAHVFNRLLNEDKILSLQRLGGDKCGDFSQKRFAELQHLVTNMLRRDPIGAYVKVKRIIRMMQLQSEKADRSQRYCIECYINNALIPIQKELENTQMIKLAKDKLVGYKIGDRELYRKIFHPLIRPNFMLTRYMSMAPKGGQLIERYKVGDTLVEIFKIPESVRLHYHITPPEFKLSDEKYSIIDSARRYLAEHKPTETEFTHPERAREIFKNIGKDMISEMSRGRSINLTAKELELMSDILARYTAGFGIIEVLLSDENIQDVYINSPIGLMPIYIGHGKYEECETNLIPTKEDAEGWATRFRMISGRPLDEANPVLDTELLVPGGRARVCAITRTLSPDGIGYALRRHRDRPWTYPLFMDVKFFDSTFAGLLSFLVDGSRSLLFAGTRSSGKTALLGATMLEIMKRFRICSLEDTLELPITQLRNMGYNVERLKSRSVITRVEAELPAEEALRTALRLGDSCLIIGEVRSTEAKALWEAMRIGALANVVAGTIHGESAYGVFDRVVNDLGVPATSFKATDIVVICNRLRSADGLRTFRRVVEVTEVRKHWQTDPMDENGFVNLMEYSAKEDKLKPSGTLLNGESFIINEIAKRVKEWHGDWNAVWSNIELRGKIKQAMLDYANKLNRKDVLEAEWTTRSNEMFHTLADKVHKEIGTLDSKEIYKRWDEWFKNELKKKK